MTKITLSEIRSIIKNNCSDVSRRDITPSTKYYQSESGKLLGSYANIPLYKSHEQCIVNLSEHVEKEMRKWKVYCLKNIRYMFENFFFLQYIFAGQLDITLSSRPSNSSYDISFLQQKSSEIVNRSNSRAKKPAKVLFQNIDTKINWLYDANYYWIHLLNISTETFEKDLSIFASVNLPERYHTMFKTLSADPIKSFVFLCLLALDPADETIQMIAQSLNSSSEPSSSYSSDYELDYFKKNILCQSGIIGSEGSLHILKEANRFLQDPSYFLDIYTLLTCADIYYYNNVNSSISDSLEKAYKCTVEVYNRGERTLSSYNLGYYNYISATQRNKYHRFDDLSFQGTLQASIRHFQESCHHGYAGAFTSLGNMCSLKNLQTYALNENFLPEEQLINIAQKYATTAESNKILFYNDYELKLKIAQSVYYRIAAENGDLNGMYNYVRILEKEIMQNNQCKKGIYVTLKKYLHTLKDYRHPKGTNLYCLYRLQELFYLESTTLPLSSFHCIQEVLKWSDFIPITLKPNLSDEARLAILKNLDLNPLSEGESLKDILQLYEYISSYTMDQLKYFFPTLHYCTLYFYSNHKPGTYHYKKIRYFLESLLRKSIQEKEAKISSTDLTKVYWLLLANSLKSNDNLEMTYIYLKYEKTLKDYYTSKDTTLTCEILNMLSSIKQKIRISSNDDNEILKMLANFLSTKS